MKKGNMAADYDSATDQSQQAAGGSFADDYDKAPAGPDQDQPADPDQDQQQDQQQDLDIPADDVKKMQELKKSGDMAALGTYVAKLLN